MYGIIIGIAVAIIAVLACLVFFILPPTVYLDPPSADNVTDFAVNAFFLRPGETVVVEIIQISDIQIIKHEEYTVNILGILSFKFSSKSFDAGEYKCVIKSSRGDIVRNFSIKTVTPILPFLPPVGGIDKVGKLKIEPLSGKAGTTFKITTELLRSFRMVTVEVVYCMNDICSDRKTVYIRKGEDENTKAAGTLTTQIETKNDWKGGYYYVMVYDDLITLSGSFFLVAPPICSCPGFHECGNKDCCAPNFKLSSLSGGSVTLCQQYGNGLTSQPVIWINFWNSSCPGCAEYMKIIQLIHDTWYKGQLKVFTINSGEDPITVKKFLSDRGYTFYNDPDYPILFDTDRSVKGRYQPGSDPCHYFIDQKGIIRMTKFGYRSINSEEEVRAIVGDINK